MNHTDLLEVIAQLYHEPVYIEIGVAQGGNFERVARHCALSFGVDVSTNPWGESGREAASRVSGATYLDCGADEFFATHGMPADLIFIDGDHSFAQAWCDFENALRFLAPLGTMAFHDTWPQDPQGAHGTGTVWRVARALEMSSRYDCFTLPTQTGVTLVRPRVERFQ